VNEVFDDNGKLVDERYDKYIDALKNQRKNGTPH